MNDVPVAPATPQYKYDVALSFLARDTALAQQIVDLVSPTQSVFFFPRKQEELAGSDGHHSFTRAFGTESRVVVVLFRQAWGETPWTRVEKDAIFDRVVAKGSEFTLFVVLGPNPSLPEWIPKRRLYYDFESYGLAGIAGAIKTRIAAMDGETRPESPIEHALRAVRASELLAAQDSFRGSEGVARVAIEFPRLQDLVSDAVKQMNSISSYGLVFELHPNRNAFRVIGRKAALVVSWRRHYSNSLNDSELTATIWTQRGRWPDQPLMRSGIQQAEQLTECEYQFGLLRDGVVGWVTPATQKVESEALSDELLHLLLEQDQKLVHDR